RARVGGEVLVLVDHRFGVEAALEAGSGPEAAGPPAGLAGVVAAEVVHVGEVAFALYLDLEADGVTRAADAVRLAAPHRAAGSQFEDRLVAFGALAERADACGVVEGARRVDAGGDEEFEQRLAGGRVEAKVRSIRRALQ